MTIPKRYLSGLSPEERKRRIDEIKRGRKTSTSDKSAYSSSRFKTDADKKTKPSKYTQRGKKLLANSNAKTLDGKLAVLSKKTGYSVGTLRQVYNRGLAAWRTGHRPGATQHAWAMARVYSFVTGGKTAQTADKDLKQRGMKEAVAFKRGLRLAKSAFGAASGAASFDTVMRKGQSVRIKRDLGGAGGGQFVSFQVAQADNLKKSVVVGRRVARMRGKPAPEVPDYRVTTSSRVPSPEELMDQLRDGVQTSGNTQPQRDSEPLWRRTNDMDAGGVPTSIDGEDEVDPDSDFGRGIEKMNSARANANKAVFKLTDNADLTPEEQTNIDRISAIRYYTSSGFDKINRDASDLLSGRREKASDTYYKFNEAFDALSEVAESDHHVFRGGGGGWTEEVLGWQSGRARDFVGSPADLRKMIGHTFRTDSFISTSRVPWVASSSSFEYPSFLNGEQVSYIFRMHRKSGSRFLPVERDSFQGVDEREIVLPPQEKYVVRGFTFAGGNHPALQDEDGFEYDFESVFGITSEDKEFFNIDNDIEIEDPLDIADGGGTSGKRPVIIIEVEQI